MKTFTGKTLHWEWREGVIELTLDHEPANEIGTAMLADLEEFVAAFAVLAPETSVCILASYIMSPQLFLKKNGSRVFAIFWNAFTPF